MGSVNVRDIAEVFCTRVDELSPGLLNDVILRGAAGSGEFYCGDELEFTATCDTVPTGDTLVALLQAHSEFRDGLLGFPGVELSAVYVTPALLARPATQCQPVPTFTEGAFNDQSSALTSVWTWAQLLSDVVTVRGTVPDVDVRAADLEDYCVSRLTGFWRKRLAGVEQLGLDRVGVSDGSVAWMVLGAAAVRGALDSGVVRAPSAAGLAVVESWDSRWWPIVVDALKSREGSEGVSCVRPEVAGVLGSAEVERFQDPHVRGAAVRDFVAFCCAVG